MILFLKLASKTLRTVVSRYPIIVLAVIFAILNNV